MPALTAIIGGNADKYEAELNRVVALTRGASSKIASESAVGGLGGANRGAMREMMVLIREIGRGNWSRVPGSASLLVQQLGIMKYLLNPITGAIIGLGVGFYASYKLADRMVTRLSGLKLPDWEPTYIAKYQQRAFAIEEAHKAINSEIEKAKELYDSADASANRLTDTLREQFDHMRRMNDLTEKNLAARISGEMRINSLEREAMLNAQAQHATELAAEADRKKAEADKLIVSVASKASDEENLKKRRADSKAAEDDIKKTREHAGLWLDATASLLGGPSGKEVREADESRIRNNRETIKASDAFEETAHQNEETRKKAAELYKEAGKADAEAAKITKGIEESRAKNSQKDQDEEEEAAARIASDRHAKLVRGHLTALQEVGAFVSPGNIALIDVAKKSEHHLSKIERHLDRHSKTGSANRMGEVQH